MILRLSRSYNSYIELSGFPFLTEFFSWGIVLRESGAGLSFVFSFYNIHSGNKCFWLRLHFSYTGLTNYQRSIISYDFLNLMVSPPVKPVIYFDCLKSEFYVNDQPLEEEKHKKFIEITFHAGNFTTTKMEGY